MFGFGGCGGVVLCVCGVANRDTFVFANIAKPLSLGGDCATVASIAEYHADTAPMASAVEVVVSSARYADTDDDDGLRDGAT